MKKLINTLAFLTLGYQLVTAQVEFTFKEWEDPSVTQLGQLPPHSFAMDYPNADDVFANDFSNFRWELTNNGQTAFEGSFSVEANAGETKSVTLNVPMLKVAAGTEILFNVYAYQRTATPSVPAGHEVARAQFGANASYFDRKTETTGDLKIEKTRTLSASHQAILAARLT